MGVRFKMRGGTARTDEENLCQSCSHSLITETSRGELAVKCLANYEVPITMTDAVVSCNRYVNKRLPDRYEFEKIAWSISVDKRTAGFIQEVSIKPPKEED